MSSQSRVAPTRRTVLRAAAWTAPAVSIAVAAPAFAATMPTTCAINGTRNAANFNVTFSGCAADETVLTVTIGGVAATLKKGIWEAQLTGNVSSTQTVVFSTKRGTAATQTFNRSVIFVG